MIIKSLTVREGKYFVDISELEIDPIHLKTQSLNQPIIEINITSIQAFQITSTEFDLLFEAMKIWKENHYSN